MPIYSLVRSVLDYSSIIWDPYHQKDINRIETTQRRAARFVQNDYKRTSSVTSMMEKLGWKPLHERRRERRLTLLYKIVNDLVAITGDQHISYNNRRSRHRHNKQLKIESADSEVNRNSFFPRTIKDWNILPHSAIDCDTVDSFKQRTPLNILCSVNESISGNLQIQTNPGYCTEHRTLTVT